MDEKEEDFGVYDLHKFIEMENKISEIYKEKTNKFVYTSLIGILIKLLASSKLPENVIEKLFINAQEQIRDIQRINKKYE